MSPGTAHVKSDKLDVFMHYITMDYGHEAYQWQWYYWSNEILHLAFLRILILNGVVTKYCNLLCSAGILSLEHKGLMYVHVFWKLFKTKASFKNYMIMMRVAVFIPC